MVNRDTVLRRTAVWLAGSAAGALIIMLPDPDVRLFSLSRTHGPGPIDMIGVIIAVAAWLPVAALLWSQRRAIAPKPAVAAASLAVAGGLLLVASIARDTGSEWLIGAALLAGAQLIALAALWTAALK